MIVLHTTRGTFYFDYLILATGFVVNGHQQPELKSIIDAIELWKDRPVAWDTSSVDQKLSRFPYLGPSFEFLEKQPGAASYLKNIYCFNYAASLSHGLVSSDIPDIGIGAERLARGIATDFFIQHAPHYFRRVEKHYQTDFHDAYLMIDGDN